MIRYDVERAKLEAMVDAEDRNWRRNAARRTKQFIENKAYAEASAIWSKVKPVFMAIQNNKCVFCERQFESIEYGKIEFDLEHFRPKSSVTDWPVAGRHSQAYEFATGGDSPSGYYWLAYDLSNYAASCKVCNTDLKLNYFPVAGERVTEPGDLSAEQPFLCYPIGQLDDDPEDLITFIATTAVPKADDGYARRRGQVIIDFFELNKRDQLHKERAHLIMLMGSSLANIDSGYGDQTDRDIITRLTSSVLPHTACLKAFAAGWRADPAFGRRVWQACRAYFAAGDWKRRPEV